MASGPFNEGVVQQNGGVAWAKQQGQILQTVPDAIDTQIAGYKAAIQQLQQVHTTVTSGSTQLQSAWSGDAADAATTAFSDTAKQTQSTIDMINNTITQLQTAKTAAQTAAAALAKVPDEQAVPHPNAMQEFLNWTGISSDHVAQIQQQNTQARTQAADVLNTLSTSYSNTAKSMADLAQNTQTSGFTPTSTGTGTFQLSGDPTGSSSGAAGSYQATMGGGGSTATGTGSGTRLEGNGPGPVETAPITGSPIPPPGSTNPPPPGGTVFPGPITGSPVPTPEPDPTGPNPEEPIGTPIGSDPEGTDPLMGSPTGGPGGEDGGSYGSTSGVFGEDGFESTTGAGSGYGSSSAYGSASGYGSGGSAGPGEEDAIGVGAGGLGEGSTSGMQQGMGGMRGGMGRGGGGGGGGEDSYNSQYSRGQYLSDEEGSPFASQDWQSPAIGGDESLLVPSEAGAAVGPTGQVTSVYDGATDAQGRPLSGGMGMGGRRGMSQDEEEERGQRPAYLKEDAEWWQSGQPHNPPVVG